MISWMQKHHKYLVITIWISTFAFIAAGFVGWGAYSYNQDRANSIAKVGEVRISAKELQRAYSNLYDSYNRMLGGKLTREKAQELKLQDIALNQLMRQALLLNYARELGLSLLDSEVIDELERIDTFKENGVFSKERYFRVLKSLGTSPKEFERSIKKELIVAKLKALLHMPATPLETESLAAAMYLSDDLKIKIIPAHPEKVKIDEEELKSYWEQHKERYQSPKRYTLEVIEVNASTLPVSEKELRAYYDEKRYRFKDAHDKILPFEKAKARVKAALQKKKAKTEALKRYLALKAGKIKAQKTLTVDATQQRIPVALLEKSAVGSYIKSLPTPEGYMTAKLLKVTKPAPLPFDQARASARKDLMIEKQFKALEEAAKAAQNDLSNAKELTAITQEDVSKIPGLQKSEAVAFLNHLFSQTKERGYYLFKDKAIVYEITGQTLLNRAKLEANRKKLERAAAGIKANETENGLIRRLQKRYKIEKYYKG